LGFTLDDVAELLETGRHRHGRRPDASLHAKAVTKLAEIEQRIADLQVIADTLRVALDVGCDDVMACAASADCPLPFADLGAPRPDRS
jgi:MerR family mercuric resistance operon transcriptional regulator